MLDRQFAASALPVDALLSQGGYCLAAEVNSGIVKRCHDAPQRDVLAAVQLPPRVSHALADESSIDAVVQQLVASLPDLLGQLAIGGPRFIGRRVDVFVVDCLRFSQVNAGCTSLLLRFADYLLGDHHVAQPVVVIGAHDGVVEPVVADHAFCNLTASARPVGSVAPVAEDGGVRGVSKPIQNRSKVVDQFFLAFGHHLADGRIRLLAGRFTFCCPCLLCEIGGIQWSRGLLAGDGEEAALAV